MEDNKIASLPAEGKRKRDESDDENLTKRDCKNEKSSQSNDPGAKMGTKKAKNMVDETTVEQSVFSNDYLLPPIFENSDFQDLKSFRQVNRLWNLEATKALLKTPGMLPLEVKYLTIRLETDDLETLIDGTPPLPMFFPQFSQFISKSLKFPCNSLQILDPLEKLMTPESKFFFQAHGNLFEKLEITFGRVIECDLRTMELNFAPCFPNLKSLFVNSLHYSLFQVGRPLEPNFPKLKLKKLKKLTFHHDLPKEAIERLLNLAPNLEKIFWTQKNFKDTQQHNFLQNLADLNAFPLLKKISLLLNPKSMEFYEQLLEQELKFRFEEIDEICFDRPMYPWEIKKGAKVLSELLNKCSQTLTKIRKLYALGDVTGLKIPTFPKVTFASVFFYTSFLAPLPEPTPLLPPGPGNNFWNIFPNLRFFEFVITGDDQTDMETIFSEPIIPMMTVRELVIRSGDEDYSMYVPTLWVKQFCEIFPKLTAASFLCLDDRALEHVWTLGCLEELKFEFGVNVKVESYPKVDSAFIGLSEECVKELYCKGPNNFKMLDADIKALAVKPSIADLKNLRKLDVLLVDEQIMESTYDYNDDGLWLKLYKTLMLGTDDLGNILSLNKKVIFSHVARKFFVEMCPLHKGFTFYFYKKSFSVDAFKQQ